MIDKLRIINDKLLRVCKDNKEKDKQELIKKILMDKKCFFKMDIETSYALLRDLHIKEEDLENVYQELIDYQYFE